MGLVAAAHKGRRLILHPQGGVHRPFTSVRHRELRPRPTLYTYYLVRTADGVVALLQP